MDDGRTLYIEGTWRPAASGQEFEAVGPADGTVLARCAVASEGEVEEAVTAARTAFVDPAWRGLTAGARARLLWRLGDLIDAHADELAELECLNEGQPLALARATTVPNSAEQLRYAAGWCDKLEGAVAPLSVPDALNYTTRVPLGVCALLPTWNFPLMSAAGKLAPALAAGNTVVMKPADPTPLTAIRLVELAQEAGFPPGVINLVTGDGDTSKAIVANADVAGVSFTGSTGVGRSIASTVAPRFAKVCLELGGKNPSIVTKNADLDQAITGNLEAALLNTGQVCAAYSRFYVHRSRVDEFVTRIAQGAAAKRVGPGMDPETELGPLVSQRQLERVDGHVQKAVAEGTELVTGGGRAPGLPESGAYYAPTVFTGVTQDSYVARTDIFGPVLAVLPYDDLDEAVALANDSEYALSASVWTRDVAEAHVVAAQLVAGGVYVNMLPLLDPTVPWGGFKISGIGKEMGATGVLDYTQEKSTWIGLA